MSLWRQLTRGVRVLMDRSAADRDVDDEVRDYFDRATASLVADGMTPDEARRLARQRWGSAGAVSARVRLA